MRAEVCVKVKSRGSCSMKNSVGAAAVYTLTRLLGWEVIAEDETKEADNNLSLPNLDSSPGASGHKGHSSSGKQSNTIAFAPHSEHFGFQRFSPFVF